MDFFSFSMDDELSVNESKDLLQALLINSNSLALEEVRESLFEVYITCIGRADLDEDNFYSFLSLRSLKGGCYAIFTIIFLEVEMGFCGGKYRLLQHHLPIHFYKNNPISPS
ncbi:hypothetical protein SLE2022_028170 [Rubroshorea leprosula]